MKAIERLYKYLDYQGIKPTVFEKKIGFSNGYLSVQKKRLADIGETVLNKVIDYCRDMNPEWLLTGRGSMLRDDKESSSINQSVSGNNNVITGSGVKINSDKKPPEKTADNPLAAQLAEKDKQINNLLDQQSKFLEQIDKLVDQQSKLVDQQSKLISKL